MIKRYTFLKHPFYFVLENSKQMVAGLEKCVGVFYNDHSKSVEALSFDKNLSRLNYEDSDFVEKLRHSNKQANWIKKEQVPFEVEGPIMEQLSFADEEQSSVLELHFPNLIDGKWDVLYLYFKNNIGNFKLSSIDEAMAVDIKGVIQTLLYNQIMLLISSNQNDSIIHQQIGNTFNDSLLQVKINQLERDQFDLARSNYMFLLTKLTQNEVVEFGLSNDAIKRLSDQNLGLAEVEHVSNGLENFGVEGESAPDLFSSDQESTETESLLSTETSENISEDDDLEIPAFLRRQKN